MKKEVHKKETRGSADFGWLQANYSFSFSDYQNRERMHFGCLRVLNDDAIQPSQGFGTHPHNDMEIVTVVLEGAIAHKDSMGNSYEISAGEAQRMSAGNGITHSEFNAKDDQVTRLLQIWVFPEKKGIEPSYEQKVVAEENRKNKIQTLVHPSQIEDSLGINQNAAFSRSVIEKGQAVSYQLIDGNQGVYVFVISGKVEIEGEILAERDAIALSEVESVSVKAVSDADVLFVDVPMELPR